MTADHDTGGIEVLESRGPGKRPRVAWHSNEHTAEPVDVFGLGPGAEIFHSAVRDHRWIYSATRAHIDSVSPPAPRPADTDAALFASFAARD